jgi:hypothetical protein
MGGPSTYYISSIYPFPTMSIPTNYFLMVDLFFSSSVSSRGIQIYSMGNPLHGVPSSGGNIYSHLRNSCHVSFSLQEASSMMIPLQPFMNQFGGGYHIVGHGHGVYQNSSWPTISQNQSFPEPWPQIPQPSTACHVGSTSPVIVSHTGIISPIYASHVGYRSKTSASHVEDQQPTVACHVGGTTIVTASHIAQTSPTFAIHATIHAGRMSLTIASHVGGIDTIENPGHIGRKTMFLCRLCKGGHLTRLCPTTTVVQEEQSLSDSPLGSESSLVSQNSNPYLVDTMVMSMQSSTDTTLLLGGDVSLDHVVLHPIQPTIEEVVMSMQSSTNPTLLLESDKSKEVTLLMQSSVNPTLRLGGDASFSPCP